MKLEGIFVSDAALDKFLEKRPWKVVVVRISEISLENLTAYGQREVNEAWVERLQDTFDARVEGIPSLAIINGHKLPKPYDGQHTIVRAKADGEEFITVKLLDEPVSVEEFAVLFDLCNSRKNVSVVQRFLTRSKAPVAYPAHYQTHEAVKSCGVVIRQKSGPNTIQAVKELLRLNRWGGVDKVKKTVSILKTAFPDSAKAFCGAWLGGVGAILSLTNVDYTKLISVLREMAPADTEDQAKKEAKRMSLKVRSDAFRGVAKRIRANYNESLTKEDKKRGLGLPTLKFDNMGWYEDREKDTN